MTLDATHVKWWAINGPDTIDNGICLCSLNYKLFVKGVTDDWRITASRRSD